MRAYEEQLKMGERWAARSGGSRLTSPHQAATGGQPGPDDDYAAMVYVQTTPGFVLAEPALDWHFRHGLRLEDFDPVRFASLMKGAVVTSTYRAILILRWELVAALPKDKMASCVFWSFMEILAHRMAGEPFMEPSKVRAPAIEVITLGDGTVVPLEGPPEPLRTER